MSNGSRSSPSSSAAVSVRPCVSRTPTTTSVPGAAQRLGCDQHRVGLADAGRGAEEDLQPPAGGARFLRFEFGEKLVGIRALLRHA